METEKIKLKSVLIALALVALMEMLLHFLVFKGAGEPILLLGGARLVEIGLLLLLFYLPSKDLNALGLNRSDFGLGVKRGLIWSLGFGALTTALLIGLHVLQLHPLEWIRIRLPEKVSDVLVLFLTGIVIGPVAEEIFFRGVLYGFFRRWGVVTALFLSTFFFVLLHLRMNPLPVPQAVGGILFALAYEREKNLYTPIVIHALGNGAIFSLSLFH
jgi:membrane protease YdiL (CAAX protease family)